MSPPHPTLAWEQDLWQQGIKYVAGVDEVGRGCWAGPVVAAAVILPVDVLVLPEVRDSKTLSLPKRLSLEPQICQQVIRWGLGLATVAEIDRLNILQATYLAMKRALSRVQPWHHALVDGKLTAKANLGGACTAVIRGDSQSYSIACAAILAKVHRDRWLAELGQRYPGYGWERNRGYGTAEHHQALMTQGVTPWHRRSFAPIRQYLEQSRSTLKP